MDAIDIEYGELFGIKYRMILCEGTYTAYCHEEKGGAIISSSSRDECFEKFKEAMAIVIFVDRIMKYIDKAKIEN